jgi:octaprenyl-diphosphate synthase
MHDFGEKIGIAFQIKDDLMDYGDDDIGKPTGIDLKEKKLTLPVIYTINHAPPATRRYIINAIKNHNTDRKRVAEVIGYVNEHGGIPYTRQKMLQYRDEALELLDTISQNEFSDRMKQLVNFIIERRS